MQTKHKKIKYIQLTLYFSTSSKFHNVFARTSLKELISSSRAILNHKINLLFFLFCENYSKNLCTTIKLSLNIYIYVYALYICMCNKINEQAKITMTLLLGDILRIISKIRMFPKCSRRVEITTALAFEIEES